MERDWSFVNVPSRADGSIKATRLSGVTYSLGAGWLTASDSGSFISSLTVWTKSSKPPGVSGTISSMMTQDKSKSG